MAPVEAEFEDGVLRPIKPLRLRPGERVYITVRRQGDPRRWDLERIAKASGSEDRQLADAGIDEWATSLDEEDHR